MAKMMKSKTALTLTLDECEPGALPPVCAKCGAEASDETRVKFRLYPSWLFLVAVLASPVWCLVLAPLVRKTRVAHMPVCARHAGTWNWGGLVVALTLGVTLPPLLMSLYRFHEDRAVLLMVAMLGGLMVALVVTASGIQPKEMDCDDMLLHGFHPKFVHAVKKDRVGGDAVRPPRATADFVTLTRA